MKTVVNFRPQNPDFPWSPRAWLPGAGWVRGMAGQEGIEEGHLQREWPEGRTREHPWSQQPWSFRGSARTASGEGLGGAGGPKSVHRRSCGLWSRPLRSSKSSCRKLLEQNLLPQLPMRVTSVSGQLNRERKSCVLGAGGAEPVMATAQPPAGRPRALWGL